MKLQVPEAAGGEKTRAFVEYEWKVGDFGRDTVKARQFSFTPECVPQSMG
jgi:hypothetical protein